MTTGVVRAAGGVVWRTGDDGVEVLLVHRPRYDDWTFPKGKRDPGESDEDCARREVEEETGLRCALGDELAPARYVDGNGRDKHVRYWAMTVEEARAWEPGEEVDDRRWLSVDAADGALTYDHDRVVLGSFERLDPGHRRAP